MMIGNDAIEDCLKKKWVDLLDLPVSDIAPHSNFFALGGNSMILLSLHIAVSQEFNIGLSLGDLFENAGFGTMVMLIQDRIRDTEQALITAQL